MTAFDKKNGPRDLDPGAPGKAANSAYAPALFVVAQAQEVPMLTPTAIWIIIAIVVALIVLYAIVRALSRPQKPEITQRREPTPEDRLPTKDVLEDRMEVEGPVEITDDMSLAEIKRAKAARVTTKEKVVRRETSQAATERAHREREEAKKAAEKAAEAADDAAKADEKASEADDAATRAQQAADEAKKAAESAAQKVEDSAKAEADSLAESDEGSADAGTSVRKFELKKPEIKKPAVDKKPSEQKAKPAFKLPKPKPKPETDEPVVETKAPAIDESVEQAPAPEEPVQEEPVQEEPVQEEPVQEEPETAAEPMPATGPSVPEAPVTVAPPAAETPEPKTLAQGLAKTRSGFIGRLSGLFSGDQLPEDMVDEVEEILFTADIGPRVAQSILQAVEGSLSGEEKQDPARIWGFIREYCAELLKSHEKPLLLESAKPFVMLVVGVNGAGKTTTIGKLASKFRAQGKKVLLVAGDTYRAGAVDQLAVWADRTGMPIHEGSNEADPSSVLFAGIERGIKEEMDVIICDTSGRLQTNVNLMDELAKMARVAGKAMDGAPHETMLVLDANTGQNAIMQAKKFNEAVEITGISLTKLDGTARGGVILGICEELDAPVRYIGIGESVEDLRAFDADEFVDALFM